MPRLVPVCLPALAGVVAALGLSACGAAPAAPVDDGPPVFPDDALVAVDTDDGALHLELRSDPQPPIVGVVPFELRVVDVDGQGVPGLDIQITPYMPRMGHGTSVVPSATDQGDGRYLVDNVDLIMPGEWELRTSLSGPASGSAAPSFDVP